MKTIIKMLVLGAVLVGSWNCAIYWKTGKVPIKAWIAKAQQDPAMEKIKAVVASGDEQKTSDNHSVKVYQWKDANGVMHYENRAVKGAKLIEVSTNSNLMPPPEEIELPKPEEKPPLTADEQVRQLQAAKQAQMDALTQ